MLCDAFSFAENVCVFLCFLYSGILVPRSSGDQQSPSLIPGNRELRNKDGDHLWRTSRDLDYIDQVSEKVKSIIHYVLHEIN